MSQINKPDFDVYQLALANAKQSRQKLVAGVERIPQASELWRLIASALVDTRIEGYLCALQDITDKIELQAYHRGYLAGLEDKK